MKSLANRVQRLFSEQTKQDSILHPSGTLTPMSAMIMNDALSFRAIMKRIFAANRIFSLAICILLLAALPAISASGVVFPQLAWMTDSAGTMTIETAAAAREDMFTPHSDTSYPRAGRNTWFRFALPSPAAQEAAYLDLNTRLNGRLPGEPSVWIVRGPGVAPETLLPVFSGLYQLPPDTRKGAQIYIRLSSAPPPSFAPSIRGAAAISGLDLEGRGWLCVILGVLFVMLLIRGILERKEWRLWAAVYTGMLCMAESWPISGIVNGLPTTTDLPGLLAPGMALLLFPHVGRFFMRSRELAAFSDLLLVLSGILGLGLTLVPLCTPHSAALRLLPLWPLLFVLMLPAALTARIFRLPGSTRFLIATLIPPLGFAAWMFPNGVGQLLQTVTPEVWKDGFFKLLPAIALCLQAAILFLLPTPRYPAAIMNRERAPQPSRRMPAVSQPSPQSEQETPQLPAQLPLSRLREDLESAAALPLSPEMKTWVKRTARELSLLTEETVPSAPQEEAGATDNASGKNQTFSLEQVILAAYGVVESEAEQKNIAFSWYMAPQLSRRYSGDRAALERVLTLLLESAVHATARGQIQLRASRLPESNDPGQLLFSVSDSGEGTPPAGRNTAALTQAWELAGRLDGAISMTSGPTGTTVSFAIRLQPTGGELAQTSSTVPPELQAALSGALRILIVSDVSAERQLLAYYLDELPHELREARGTAEAVAMYARTPGALVLFDGNLPESDIAYAVAKIRAIENEKDYPLTSILGLANDEAQGDRLRRAGCSHIMVKPVARTHLRHLALRLAPLPKARARQKSAQGSLTGEKRRQSSVTITLPDEKNWMLLTAPGKIKTEPAAPSPAPAAQPPAISAPDVQGAETLSTDTPHVSAAASLPSSSPDKQAASSSETGAAAPLRFLQPPTLRTRSNVGEPMPISRTELNELATARAARIRSSDTDGTQRKITSISTRKDRSGAPAGEEPLSAQDDVSSVQKDSVIRPEAGSRVPSPETDERPVGWVGTPTPIIRGETAKSGITASGTLPPRETEELPPKATTPSATARAAGKTGETAVPPLRLHTASANKIPFPPAGESSFHPPSGVYFAPRQKKGFFARLFGFGKKTKLGPDDFELYDAPPGGNAYEWVGEPMPVTTSSPSAAASTPASPNTPADGSPQTALHADAVTGKTAGASSGDSAPEVKNTVEAPSTPIDESPSASVAQEELSLTSSGKEEKRAGSSLILEPEQEQPTAPELATSAPEKSQRTEKNAHSTQAERTVVEPMPSVLDLTCPSPSEFSECKLNNQPAPLYPAAPQRAKLPILNMEPLSLLDLRPSEDDKKKASDK